MDKIERIQSSTEIARIFQIGNKWSSYPLLIFYLESEHKDFMVRAAFTVSKKRFKRAVDRNRIKRLMRESHRLNKYNLYEQNDLKHKIDLVYVYIGNEIATFKQIEEKTKSFIGKLVHK